MSGGTMCRARDARGHRRVGIVLAVARANQPLQEMLKRAGLTERIGAEHLYPTVRTGVQAFLEQQAK